MLDGFCDLLRSAAGRDGALNTSASAVVVRSALESSGQSLWLLETGLSGDERGRRYLTWRFDDLKQLRYMLQSGSGVSEADQAASQYADNVEQELMELAEKCKWDAKPQLVRPQAVEPACLLSDDGKSVRIPGNGDFAVKAALASDAYMMLSLPAHGQRYGFHAATVADGETGQHRTSGSTIEPGLLVQWACTAAALPALALAGTGSQPINSPRCWPR